MRKLLVFLIVLLVLVVGVDIAGRAIAESKAGEAIANQGNLSPAPDVNIHGFSFLWQAVGGDYGHITLSSQGLTAGKLVGITATADLYDVKLAISEAVSGNVDNLTATRADLTAAIPAAALSSAIGGAGLKVSAGAAGALRLSTTVEAGGQALPVTVDVKPTVTNSVLHLAGAKLVDSPAAVLPALVSSLVRGLNLELPLTDLPFPLRSASALVLNNSLVVTGRVDNLKIGEILKAAG